MQKLIDFHFYFAEREKPSSLLLEKQREALLVKSVTVAAEQSRDDGVHERAGAEAEAEPAAPGVGRWGAEWPSWLASDAQLRARRRDVTAPLPSARWGPPRRALSLSLARHEALVTRAEGILRRLLVTDNYDSVNNFISLYDTFQRGDEPLYDVYDRYNPPIRAKKHTCVGLGFELIRRWRCLERDFEGVTAATALLSCEEAVVDVPEYVSCGEGPESVTVAEKEHVMIGIQIYVEGRPGIMLADPGYHVPRIVTVMADRAYPHTGKLIFLCTLIFSI